ncbi:hypothetical protein M378DRAFT_24853 [Amanita muscaria Koide BX008]|uniref:Uncharacterized protein n=1 Tax=Amanita muscaria (strain Koide BX008) TaxID=946122 RepID=A0A0C2WQ45_AMAMK|nr:hypothetical protein M378DRAFT_24853 [Amanita muscaria Koide BX008]
MERLYTQVPNRIETTELADDQTESKSDLRDQESPSPRLPSEVAQLYPLRSPQRSYISSPLSSTAFSFPNTFKPDSSPSGLSSKAHKDGVLASPNNDHQQRASSGSRLLFRLPDENGVLSTGEKSDNLFGSTSTRHSSTSSSGASSLLLPCDHSRYPLDKFRKLEEFVAYDYDLYETKEPDDDDDDDWLHVPDSNSAFPSKRFALPWRGIANVGFLAVLLIIILFLFVGLPIYTTIVQGWDAYVAV